MIVRNNRPRKDYLIYKVSGVTKRKVIDAYSTLDIPEITDINQIVLEPLERKMRHIESTFGFTFQKSVDYIIEEDMAVWIGLLGLTEYNADSLSQSSFYKLGDDISTLGLYGSLQEDVAILQDNSITYDEDSNTIYLAYSLYNETAETTTRGVRVYDLSLDILSDNLFSGDTGGYSGDGQVNYTNFINDGYQDMYDDGNILHTNRTFAYVNGRSYFSPVYIFSAIQYTHEKQSDMNEFTGYTGTEIASGDTYFGAGSTYFTSLYDGFFLLAAHDIDISEFSINGELGADGEGSIFTTGFTTSLSGDSYSVFAKNVYNASDPSICHIIITDADKDDIIQLYSNTTYLDNHCVRNITGATKLYFMVLAKAEDNVFSYSEILDTANSLIQLQQGQPLSGLVANLSGNSSAITSNYSGYTAFSDEGIEENMTINFREALTYPYSIAYSGNGNMFGITTDSLYLINTGGTVTLIGGDFSDANSIALSGETLFMCVDTNSSAILIIDKDTGLLIDSSSVVLGNDVPRATEEAKIEDLNSLFMSNGELHVWAYIYLGYIDSQYTFEHMVFKISDYNSTQNTLEYVGTIEDSDIVDFVSIPTN